MNNNTDQASYNFSDTYTILRLRSAEIYLEEALKLLDHKEHSTELVSKAFSGIKKIMDLERKSHNDQSQ